MGFWTKKTILSNFKEKNCDDVAMREKSENAFPHASEEQTLHLRIASDIRETTEGCKFFPNSHLKSFFPSRFSLAYSVFTPTPIPNFIREEKAKRDGFFLLLWGWRDELAATLLCGISQVSSFSDQHCRKGVCKDSATKKLLERAKLSQKDGKKQEKKSYHGREMKWV